MSRRDLLLYAGDLGWRDLEPAAPSDDPSAGGKSSLAEDPSESADLVSMAGALAGCRRCRLATGRTQVVFGVGHPRARLMLIGEGPGSEEDRRGEPFVGRAGQLLNEMLRAIGLRRDDVYIANIVKCRPPANRDPEEDEAAACLPFLRRQIELVEPEVLVTLGRIAARFLLGTSAPISSYRGRWTALDGRPVLPTFHPAYLLRTPAAKAQAWEDLKAIRRRLLAGS
jgi:uracil-DNA glycosylase